MRMTQAAIRIRLALAAGLTLMAMVVTLALKIGPVIATLAHNHGIHEGDVLALPLMTAATWLVGSVVQGAARVTQPARIRA